MIVYSSTLAASLFEERQFEPAIPDDNPPMDAAFLSGMNPSRRGRPKLEAPRPR